MSKVAINQYYIALDKAIQFGKSTNETSVRNYFWILLNEYAHKRRYEVVTERDCLGTKGKAVRPDGIIKTLWGLDVGLWESKDEKDDLDAEIEAKIRKGYPLTNILFEDTQNAVLFQRGEEVACVPVRDTDQLDRVLNLFFDFKSETVYHFEDAIEKFKADIPAICDTLRDRIVEAREKSEEFQKAQQTFFELCQSEINPDITIEDIREMMIQHILTSDIFNRIFDDPEFHRHNTIAAALEELIGKLFTYSDRKNLLMSIEHYYEAINATAAGIIDHHEKQKFLKVLYENFYKVYNPKAADRLGVVYTPNEIVQFMVRSADYLLHKHFGKTLADKNVEILDPATGTGTFICEIIENAIPGHQLEYKYKNEIHANEVAILPYYIANLNIEFTYKQKMQRYDEFPNLCFVDTLDNIGGLDYEGKQELLFGLSSENTERIRRQNTKKISVIIGNPPYNANQLNENENNKNREYPDIDRRIKETYIRHSTAQKTKVYDMYARFYRWAMDRIDKNGIVAFITNRSFIDSRTFDGFRKCVQGEFSECFIIDTKSDVRANPKIAGTTHNVFGIQTGVAIMFLVKKEKRGDDCRIHYTTMEDDWRKEEKLEWLRGHQLEKIEFEAIHPDANNYWINLAEDNDWEELIPVASKDVKLGRGGEAIFELFSLGVVSNRDEWVYDDDENVLEEKVNFLIDIYNQDLVRLKGKTKGEIKDEVDYTIKWTRAVKNDLSKGKEYTFDKDLIIESLYRPFRKKKLYFSKELNEMQYQNPVIYGSDGRNINKAINSNTNGKDIRIFASGILSDLHFLGDNQCLPLYRYDSAGTRHENITDWALERFRERYGNPTPALPVNGEGDREGVSCGEDPTPALPVNGEGERLQVPPVYGGDLGGVSSAGGEGGVPWQVPSSLWRRLKPIARELRTNQTKAEKLLWSFIRGKKRLGVKFRRQHAIERFIVDFYNSEFKIIIEVDGEVHNEQVEADAIRQEFLEALGYKVIRFTNDEIFTGLDMVLEIIDETILERKKNPPKTAEYREIQKEDIFHYVYGVLHNPEYREKYELNLKREFPRIPFYDDFWRWANWGEELMDLHIEYETVEPFGLKRIDAEIDHKRALKVKLTADKERGVIVLDEQTSLYGIPPEAWEYKLGNRSALEWILDQYKEKKPRDETIREKFNTYRFADYKEQVIDLLDRACTVSVETMRIVGEMEEGE